MKVLNFGSLNLDYVYSVDHIVMPGETLSSAEMNTFCGGKGLNQSIALAKAGVSVYQAGLIGEDGGALVYELRKAGVNTEFVKFVQGKTGHAIIQVDKSGQNCILLYGGANQKMTKSYIDEVLSHFDKGDILLLQNEINLLNYIIECAYEKGMMIILNPSPYNEKLNPCDFGKISLFLLNEVEGGQITGESRPEEILKKMRESYPDAKIMLTLGSEGCVYRDKDRTCHAGIFKVDAVDTTAAGDTFTGYFISSIIDGLPVEEGLRLASKASAIAVTREGAAPSIPTKEEVLNTEL